MSMAYISSKIVKKAYAQYDAKEPTHMDMDISCRSIMRGRGMGTRSSIPFRYISDRAGLCPRKWLVGPRVI